MKSRKFGWKPDTLDFRDYKFKNTFRVSGELPEKIDLRDKCSPIEDQGDLGSCTAQALVGALEFLEIKSGVKTFSDLSRLFVYYNERAREGTILEDSGAMLRTGIKVLRGLGVCRESLWPYQVNKFKQLPASECYEEGKRHQIASYQRLLTLAEMKACLAMGLPFVFGFACYDSLMSAEVTKTGNVPMPGKNESCLGGHAIMAVGYDDERKVAIFRNSWGTAWGDAGYGTLPYAYLEDRDLSDDFWCIQTTESDLYCEKYAITEEVMV